MSIGTWLLTFFIMVSVVYAYTFVPNAPGLGERQERLRTMLAWVSVPLGIATAVYTGVLLGAMPARPFWNSPVLALLFLVSSLSTGVALILLARSLFGKRDLGDEEGRQFHQSGYLLTASDLLLIGGVKEAVSIILFGGDLGLLFWLGVVVVGLLIPGIVELFYVVPKLVYYRDFAVPRLVEFAIPVVVLVGAFMLRYVVVIAGQLTGPTGI